MEMLNQTPAIQLTQFSFGFEDTPLIGPIDWIVEEGSFALLVGNTGCGKTTLLRNLKPELAPHGHKNGTIALFGTPINQLSAQQSAQIVGYVAQSPENQIVCDTVWHELAFGLENLGVPNDVMKRRVAEVSNFFGLESLLNQSTSELSGGQKQLITLASILALRPRILLLDEPTSQLDPVASKSFLHALFRVNRELGLTVVVVTHEPEIMAQYATSFTRFDHKTLIERDVCDYRKELQERSLSVDYHAAGICADPVPDSAPVAIQLKDVYVRYKRELPFVLRGCDFIVKQGSIHALVGGNGSGKSTLLATIIKTMKISRGSLTNRFLKEQAFLPQNPKTLFVCDTALEELQEWQKPCGYSDEDIACMARRFSLESKLDLHPFDLSGGQQQLLACAKVLLTRPELLIMDEPTKGLDVRSKYILADALCAIAKQGTTILFVTHDLSFAARVANVTSMLFDGSIACTQATSDFFAENLFYRPTVDWFFTTWDRPEILREKIALGQAQPWNFWDESYSPDQGTKARENYATAHNNHTMGA